MRSRSDATFWPGPTVSGASGFTLIELLVVLAIMGLLLIVIPQVTAGLPRFRLQASTASLADTLRQLRDDAIRTGQTTTLLFDTAHVRYQATGDTDWQRLPSIVQEIELSCDTPTRSPEPVFRFFPDGSATGGAITLRHGSQTAAITIEWLTGRVRND